MDLLIHLGMRRIEYLFLDLTYLTTLFVSEILLLVRYSIQQDMTIRKISMSARY